MIHQMILNFKSLPLVNRLNKQDFYNFIIGELAYKMEKKNWRRNHTYSLQFKISTPEFEKWKLVFKAFISSSQCRFPQTSNCNCMVLCTFPTFSFQSLKNQLSNKA